MIFNLLGVELLLRDCCLIFAFIRHFFLWPENVKFGEEFIVVDSSLLKIAAAIRHVSKQHFGHSVILDAKHFGKILFDAFKSDKLEPLAVTHGHINRSILIGGLSSVSLVLLLLQNILCIYFSLHFSQVEYAQIIEYSEDKILEIVVD